MQACVDHNIGEHKGDEPADWLSGVWPTPKTSETSLFLAPMTNHPLRGSVKGSTFKPRKVKLMTPVFTRQVSPSCNSSNRRSFRKRPSSSLARDPLCSSKGPAPRQSNSTRVNDGTNSLSVGRRDAETNRSGAIYNHPTGTCLILDYSTKVPPAGSSNHSADIV